MGRDPGFDPIIEARRQWLAHDLDEVEAMVAVTSLIHAQQLVTTAVDRALRPHGLTFARYEVLMLLSFSRRGSLPITKMADRLMVHQTGITRLVDKLEQDGFVERTRNPDDRRGVLASITSAGRKVARQATKAVTAIRFGMELPDEDLGALSDLLKRLRDAADRTR